jgi:heme a synthase
MADLSTAELVSSQEDIPPRGLVKSVFVWLMIVYCMIFAMVMVGGITRLTGSGLSMVEWHPLMGAVPPSGAEQWNNVFQKYQKSPQYKKVNHWMTIDDFKRIFFWEYFHRLLGRLIGVVFFLPWLYFVIRKRIRGKLLIHTLYLFFLGGAQGLLGWYMVKSGLVDQPAVSHYRLAAHLMLAFFVAVAILWVVFNQRHALPTAPPAHKRLRLFLLLFTGLLVLQIVYGAFMAGTRAGYLYSTFPTMNGEWIPTAFFGMKPAWRNFLENPTGIHFLHRLLGWLLIPLGLAIWAFGRKDSFSHRRRSTMLIGTFTLVQFLLGALTVIFHMPIWLATIHQGGALLLLSVAAYGLHSSRKIPALSA